MLDFPPLIWPAMMVATLAGCSQGGDAVVVATTWGPSERRALGDEFRAWLAGRAGEGPSRLEWVGLDPREDLDEAAGRIGGVDVVLGATSGGVIARRSRIALALRPGAEPPPSSWDALGEPSARDRLALDDPRDDPATLALASARLRALGWPRGYAWLVRLAANARPIGRGRGSALATLGRRGADWAVLGESRGMPLEFSDLDPSIVCDEVVRRVDDAPHPERAGAFVRFLRERSKNPALTPALSRGERGEDGHPLPPGEGRGEGLPQDNPLLADLLGATLVDEQDELRPAWESVIKTGRPGAWEARLTVAPPWPPASVTQLIRRHAAAGEDPGPWVETLANQVAADPFARVWLLTTWGRDPRPIDGRFLDELLQAADGRLAADSTFRAWLRAEWTAWAGQRYRWVARRAGGPPS
ncbi:MAG TPA: substrate-binding domain-containing protein [Isosphaeraceae bacterium]|nr:substrate-binding domain-containing protein [Isosphaeraceae bacterium]